MNAKRLVTIAVATMVLLTAGVAAGTASTVDQASDNAPDEGETDGPDADRAGGDRSVGPSDGLPEQVPGHVSTVFDSVESFLNGSIDSLGGLLGNTDASSSNTGA